MIRSFLSLLKMPVPSEIVQTAGPVGALEGCYVPCAHVEDPPAILIIPGSGPTDRDGNNQLGLKSNMYKMLAEALAGQGIASLRIDKRGMFGSERAVHNPDKVRLKEYADDVLNWVRKLRDELGHTSVFALGHSEGGVVALKAALQNGGVDGVILAAAPGRPIDVVFQEQLNMPQNKEIAAEVIEVLNMLRAGEKIDVAASSATVQSIFKPDTQDYWLDLMAHNPAEMIAQLSMPTLIVQAGKDVQVHVTRDGEALAKAAPEARYVCLPHANHVFKPVKGDDLAQNFAAYAKPRLKLVPRFIDEVAQFVTAQF